MIFHMIVKLNGNYHTSRQSCGIEPGNITANTTKLLIINQKN